MAKWEKTKEGKKALEKKQKTLDNLGKAFLEKEKTFDEFKKDVYLFYESAVADKEIQKGPPEYEKAWADYISTISEKKMVQLEYDKARVKLQTCGQIKNEIKTILN